jgi:hypothetical protein
MTEDPIQELESPSLATRSEFQATGATVSLVGDADMDAIQPLGAYLSRLHSAAMERKCPSIAIDMHELRFINSSCLKQFVIWVTKVQDLGAGNRYTIVFKPNPERPTQRWSLTALKALAEDVVIIDA